MSDLDANFFKPFVEGTIKTLKVQCSTDAKPGKPFIKGTQKQPDFDLAGIIGITSESFNGSIVLCFSKQVFLELMNKMLGETFTEISDDLQSGAAELLNIIFGSAKVVLNEKGYAIQKAIPSVIRGSQLKTSVLSQGPVMVLPFSLEQGEFYIEIAKETKGLT